MGIRRPNREEEPEPQSPCPISKQSIPITQLECPTTKDAIPMCVVSGRHMEADDWCICPNSNMPALLSQYIEYLESEGRPRVSTAPRRRLSNRRTARHGHPSS